MNDQSGKFVLLEPSSPEALIPDAWLEPWMIGLALVFLTAFAAIIIVRKKKKAASDPAAARRQAHAAAAHALEKIQSIHTREAAVQSSLILRRYLSAAAGDPALFETHEETIARHDAFQNFSPEARASAAHGFNVLAALKYAPEVADVAASDVIRDSRILLNNLDQGFQA